MKKPQIAVLLLGIVVAAGVYAYVSGIATLEPQTNQAKAMETVFAIIDEGVDFENSLYPPEDYPVVTEKLEAYKEVIKEAGEITTQDVDGIMSWFYTASDYDHVFQLAEVNDFLDAEDFSYRIVRARANMKIGNLDAARTELQLIKQDWGVPDTYLTLAEVYKLTPDTDNSVIDDIYKEAIDRITATGRFEVIQAYIEWLEDTEREEMTIQYYEELNSLLPQEQLETRLKDLKQKYQ